MVSRKVTAQHKHCRDSQNATPTGSTTIRQCLPLFLALKGLKIKHGKTDSSPNLTKKTFQLALYIYSYCKNSIHILSPTDVPSWQVAC